MYAQPIGISILTNGNKRHQLQTCIEGLLANCFYRPLKIAVYDNGSTDDTGNFIALLDKMKTYGVSWVVDRSSRDTGCAAGTNHSCEMVRDCEYAIHLESDFEHLSGMESGEDRLWLRRAVEFLTQVKGNYMYLRRMVDEREMMMHWWSQWMTKIEHGGTDRYLSCSRFWWSNNPSLFNNQALYKQGTLPLNAANDGPKGTPQWSKPEMEAKSPGKAWIHRWGLFVHERQKHGNIFEYGGCGHKLGTGTSMCKYGFFKNGQDHFCQVCRKDLGMEDMQPHEHRFRSNI